MLAITLTLLVLGALLAAFGTAGFALNWTAPDHDSLRYTQGIAKAGRRLSAAGLTLYALHYGASGPALIALLLAAALALATYLTRTTSTLLADGGGR